MHEVTAREQGESEGSHLRQFEVTTPVVNSLCQAKLKAHSLSLAKHTKAVVSNVMTSVVQLGSAGEEPGSRDRPAH